MDCPVVAIGADHGGFDLKAQVLNLPGFKWDDCGTYDRQSVDYPDYAHKVAQAVLSGNAQFGILICKTGIGMSMAANRHKGIRAALCINATMATYARQHNDANILILGAQFVSSEEVQKCIDTFLKTGFEGGRHAQRVEKIEV
jgi:ribose 5-phosphate isomerase B